MAVCEVEWLSVEDFSNVYMASWMRCRQAGKWASGSAL
jgi:hypothetical protein